MAQVECKTDLLVEGKVTADYAVFPANTTLPSTSAEALYATSGSLYVQSGQHVYNRADEDDSGSGNVYSYSGGTILGAFYGPNAANSIGGVGLEVYGYTKTDSIILDNFEEAQCTAAGQIVFDINDTNALQSTGNYNTNPIGLYVNDGAASNNIKRIWTTDNFTSVVDLTTAQTITANKTFSGADLLLKDDDNITLGTGKDTNIFHGTQDSDLGTHFITSSGGFYFRKEGTVAELLHIDISDGDIKATNDLYANDYYGNDDVTKTDIPENATVMNSVSSTGNYAVKAGRLIISDTYFVTNTGQTGFKTLATLPVGSRPDAPRQIRGYEVESGGVADNIVLILLDTDGTLKTTVKSEASYYFDYECTLTQP